METERFVSLKEMKEALIKETGNASPIKVIRNNGEATVLFIRGFADPQTNILLFSETFGSVGLKIMEVKDIRSVEYPEGNQTSGSIRVLNAKWNKKLLILFAPFFLF